MENNKEIIDNGKFVAFAYTVKDADSKEVLFEAKKAAPDMMIYGVTQDVIPGLAATLKGLKAGDKFGVTLPLRSLSDTATRNMCSRCRSRHSCATAKWLSK